MSAMLAEHVVRVGAGQFGGWTGWVNLLIDVQQGFGNGFGGHFLRLNGWKRSADHSLVRNGHNKWFYFYFYVFTEI